MAKAVLIVDDSKLMRNFIIDALSSTDEFQVIGEAASGEAAIDLAIELSPDIITIDNILPDMLGTDIISILKEENINSELVMISGIGSDDVIQEVFRLGAKNYLVKPFTPDQLLGCLRGGAIS